MTRFWNVELKKAIIHYVGNKSSEDGYKLSDKLINISDEQLQRVLLNYFLKSFEDTPFNNFTHPTNLHLNEIYSIASEIFSDGTVFLKKSKEIGRLLYDCSTHPNIKAGDLYIAYLQNCSINNENVDAIGLFKSENKELFLKTILDNRSYDVNYEEGININKLDKGCLIFNINKQNGYEVAVVDNNKSNEAKYWRDDLLKIKPSNDDYNNTLEYLNFCKDFVTNKLNDEFEINKTDKIDYLNRTVDYFKGNSGFNEREFLEEVFDDSEVIKSFKKYKKEFENDNEVEISNDFDISAQALKKQSRVFKSVLKLDKNFHVYIHGDKNLIEKGYDSKLGKHYYKIYFDEEK